MSNSHLCFGVSATDHFYFLFLAEKIPPQPMSSTLNPCVVFTFCTLPSFLWVKKKKKKITCLGWNKADWLNFKPKIDFSLPNANNPSLTANIWAFLLHSRDRMYLSVYHSIQVVIVFIRVELYSNNYHCDSYCLQFKHSFSTKDIAGLAQEGEICRKYYFKHFFEANQ